MPTTPARHGSQIPGPMAAEPAAAGPPPEAVFMAARRIARSVWLPVIGGWVLAASSWWGIGLVDDHAWTAQLRGGLSPSLLPAVAATLAVLASLAATLHSRVRDAATALGETSDEETAEALARFGFLRTAVAATSVLLGLAGAAGVLVAWWLGTGRVTAAAAYVVVLFGCVQLADTMVEGGAHREAEVIAHRQYRRARRAAALDAWRAVADRPARWPEALAVVAFGCLGSMVCVVLGGESPSGHTVLASLLGSTVWVAISYAAATAALVGIAGARGAVTVGYLVFVLWQVPLAIGLTVVDPVEHATLSTARWIVVPLAICTLALVGSALWALGSPSGSRAPARPRRAPLLAPLVVRALEWSPRSRRAREVGRLRTAYRRAAGLSPRESGAPEAGPRG